MGSFVANYNSYTLDAAQAVEGVTPYGSNKWSVNAGSGTPDLRVSIGAAWLAHATGTAPDFQNISMFAATGLATVLTLDTGCTESFNLVVARFSLGHARMRAAVGVSIAGANAGEVTEVYAIS